MAESKNLARDRSVPALPRSVRNIDLNLLTVFDAILTEGSLTRASRKFFMSQPAMSNALSRLRIALGDPIFIRTSEGMVPTPRARRLAGPVRQALDLIQNGLREQGSFQHETSTRKFVIAIGDYGEVVIMPRFMEWLTHTAPEIQIQIRPEAGRELTVELRAGSVDLAMDYFPIRAADFSNLHLMDEVLLSMVRNDHSSVGDSLTLDDYLTLPHVVREHDRPIVDSVLKKLGHTRKIALRVPHFLSMPLIVQKTNFISTLPRRMGQVYAELFRTRLLRTPVDFPRIPIYLMWHQSANGDAGHIWLRQSLYDLCQRL